MLYDMDVSVFTDKTSVPSGDDLCKVLGDTYPLWQSIRDYLHGKSPALSEEWKHPGEKHGWSFRVRDSKRVIVYLLPREGFFKAAFVFGAKAVEEVMRSNVAESIKKDLAGARAYVEGKGIRIDVRDASVLDDIRTLADIKMAN
jgi:hypothetical protein